MRSSGPVICFSWGPMAAMVNDGRPGENGTWCIKSVMKFICSEKLSNPMLFVVSIIIAKLVRFALPEKNK